MTLLTPAPTGRWNGRYEITCDPPCSSKQKHGARFRSPDWIADYGAHVGGTVFLDMPEMGVEGLAEVIAIEPCPPLEEGEGRLVTGTFKHTSGEVYDLKLESESKPIGVTATHPFWSVDREDWVSAIDLEIGETLKTLEGTTVVESRSKREEPETVYNIEVEGDHVYRVGESGVLVHNASAGVITKSECRNNIEDLRKNFGFEESVVAYVEFKINGESDELIAVRGEDTPAGTVGLPTNPIFSPSVVGTYLRDVDAEYKLLEAVAARLDKCSKAVVRLCIEREPCDSCADVIRQFKVKFPEPNVVLHVTYL